MAKIFISSVINAPIDAVWAKMRDFNGLADWHPLVAESHIEDGEPSDRVGCVRTFRLADGGLIRERLLALSDMEHFYTYSILESPMPVDDYAATLALLPITDGDQTYAQWTADFRCPMEEEEGLVAMIGGDVFLAGLRAVAGELEG